jgi:cyclomaltodextrinase
MKNRPAFLWNSNSRFLLTAFTLATPLLLAPELRAQTPAASVTEAPGRSATFEFRPDHAVKSVNVAGTFNNWDKGHDALVLGADGVWRATLRLPFGRHNYKFVLDGEQWIPDPKAPSQDDGSGNLNSVLLVLPPDYARPASPSDGIIARSALQHEMRVPDLNFDRGKLRIALRARPNDFGSVRLRVGGQSVPMQLESSDELYARYTAQFPWDRKRDLDYAFELQDGATTSRFGADGLGNGARPFHLSAQGFKPFVVPGWVEQTVFYQIFPDRFDNGDKTNDPPDVMPWNAKPTYANRFGGDVAGVTRHLDHLQNLGVSGVYFNPIFESPSNHRYDAQDYKKLAPDFGTNAEFAALTRELQKRGMRTVMDFVFNHTATTFPAFADVRKNGESSPYKNWYFIKSYPVEVKDNPNYVAWYGYPSMPKLNLLNPPTHEYMLGLVDFWKHEVPLAGLRLDVANEVDMRFWRDLRARAKTLDPQTWIVGEVWGDGSPWLGGDQWDSVMNYQFRDACLRFFAEGKTSPTQFSGRLMNLVGSYAPQASRNMMNLLSSHDTPRFLTLCGNNGDLARLGATLQMTWVGAPSIYYGEELGMEGGADPDNRRPMEWSRATNDNPMLRHYKRLIRLRKASRALQSGDPQILLADDGANTLAFARVLPDDLAVVALNRSNQTRVVTIPLPPALAGRASAFTDGLSGARVNVSAHSLRVTLAPLSAAVLVPAPPR